MIGQDQKILFVSNARAIAIIKENKSLNTGFTYKKIVVTTRRCLVFESLTNKIDEIQYEVVKNKVSGKDEKELKKSRISINEYPQFWFDANQRDVKVVIDQQPSILKYLAKAGIKNLVNSTVGMVLLKNPKKQKLQFLLFPALNESFKFAKGLMCAKAWLNYEKHCSQNQMQTNLFWARILQQIVTHNDSLTLIDPDLFKTGTIEQMKAFLTLVTFIPFAHSFQLRYLIVNDQSIYYTVQFIKNLEQKIHSITLSKTGLNSQNLMKILSSNLKIKNLMKLNLEQNQLTDQCFNGLQLLVRENKKLSYINLSHNQITLVNFNGLLQFLKATPVILNLNLSYNKIQDASISNFQKFILFALNPPIEEIDISFNDFTLKGAWRLYIGFLKNFKNHVYLNFIIYPIPFKKEIFSEAKIDFPVKEKQMNFNMHSALISQFEQQSLMKHTLTDIATPGQTLTIRFIRQLLPNVRLPKNKQQVSKTLELSNKIQNFIYQIQSVEKIHDKALLMKNFPFQVLPKTRNNFVAYLNKKLNEALLIRDHYSVKYILKSMKELQIPLQGYSQRLERVQKRDTILCKRLQSILQFRHHQATINKQIDQVVKQSLRLYLQGRGIQLLYYLKYYRDQYVERLLGERYNPEHQLYGKMASRNLSVDERVSAKDFIIPYQIKIQKRINENFYLHPWQTNYLILCQMTTQAFDQCLQFLQQSQKRETFTKYFQRIEERVEFIKNQFTLFTYKQFKVSYNDLKVNACRLLFLYKNIQDTHFYLEIPIYIKKRPITCQKQILVNNHDQFLKKYHLVNYPNINYLAKKNNFYNFPDQITRYVSQTFQNQARKTLILLNQKIFKVIEHFINSRKPKKQMFESILLPVKELLDIVRHSIYPEELKEEIYLHLIGWRKGKYGRNTEVIEMIPWLTMYLKPPVQIEKYLVAAVLQSKREQIEKFPLCIVSQVNKPTPDDILKLDAEFVERDWMPPENIMTELMMNSGKLQIGIHLLDKKKIVAKVPQSMNVSQLMSYIMGFHELSCEDRQCFWLYILDKQTQQTTPLTGCEYLGQIVSNMMSETQIFICRRRLYCRQIKHVFSKYGQAVIDSIYSQIKFEYMMRGLFDSDKNIFQIASLLFIIDNVENYNIIQRKDPRLKDKRVDQYILDQVNRIESIYPAYIPRQIVARIMKDKETIFSQIKGNVGQRMLKNQHLAIYEMKINFIRHFQSFPEFCSTNYKMFDQNLQQLKVFINCMYLYVQSQNHKEYIKIEKIISIIPKAKYILISYHKNQNIIGQVPLFSQEVNILAVAMDLLSYCLIRIKMVSNNLYQINKYERIEWQIEQIQGSLKRIYDKSLQQKLFKNRQQRQSISAKIMKMRLTLVDLKQLIYYNESNYIKSFLDRKLYANKSERKMAYKTQMDEQQVHQTQIWNRNVFKSVFPQYEQKYGARSGQMGQQLDDYNQDSDYDVDFYSQHQVVKKDRMNKGLQQMGPNQQTLKKAGNKQLQTRQKGLRSNEYVSTSKKQQSTQPQKNNQPYDQPLMTSSKLKPRQLKPLMIPSQEQEQPKIKPQQQPPKQPIQSQKVAQSKPLQANLEEDAVFSNKKAGGRNIPPRRRQK